tara:strand:+ start:213 stop:818 length:606 start_codon:yes stop_codon:yes gene_type:complete
VAELSKKLPTEPQVISLDPTYIGDVLDDIRKVGIATDKSDLADNLADSLETRINTVREIALKSSDRPRVLQLEWTEPLLSGGHWVVEMVELAGGISVFGDKTQSSMRLDWDEIVASQPEVILLMPCGFDLDRAREDIPTLTSLRGWDSLPAVQQGRAYVLDASAYTSRLGPRLITGLEIMAQLIHPELFSGMLPEGSVAAI